MGVIKEIKLMLSHQENKKGVSIINLIITLVFLLLIGLGIRWVMKQVAQTGQEYSESLVNTQSSAEALQCQMNMRSIWQVIQTSILTEDSLPESQEELMRLVGNTRLFKCQAGQGQSYVYIPGQRTDMPGTNVLLYEPQATHNGKSNVLLLSGQVVSMIPEELKIALTQTEANIR